ncbi:MAG: transcriptional repressor [Verrucomicrobia bacterium]|jgi:Fur family transcriptional regulator, peroxide stress response regulator|nr:transcriptional repressor [Verrucomicrobiota bacterium]
MTSQVQIDQRVKSFIAACRQHGIKATQQRMEILRELASTEEHPDAETVFARVRKRLPTISLDTVYRTLRTLEENEIISRVGSMRERARFDANTAPHHHFVCSDCGLIGDFYCDELQGFPPPPEVADMGSVDSVYIELRGRCRACQIKRDRTE